MAGAVFPLRLHVAVPMGVCLSLAVRAVTERKSVPSRSENPSVALMNYCMIIIQMPLNRAPILNEFLIDFLIDFLFEIDPQKTFILVFSLRRESKNHVFPCFL